MDLLAVQGTLSQESSPTLQLKSINYSVLSLLYGPTLTSIHDYWIKHSIDYMELVSKVTVPLFHMLSRFLLAFLPRSTCLLVS